MSSVEHAALFVAPNGNARNRARDCPSCHPTSHRAGFAVYRCDPAHRVTKDRLDPCTDEGAGQGGHAMQMRYAVGGVVAGLVGGLAMAIYTMTNELLSGHSIFTPLYMTAAPLVGMGAMERGMSGGALHFELVPAMVGMVV